MVILPTFVNICVLSLHSTSFFGPYLPNQHIGSELKESDSSQTLSKHVNSVTKMSGKQQEPLFSKFSTTKETPDQRRAKARVILIVSIASRMFRLEKSDIEGKIEASHDESRVMPNISEFLENGGVILPPSAASSESSEMQDKFYASMVGHFGFERAEIDCWVSFLYPFIVCRVALGR